MNTNLAKFDNCFSFLSEHNIELNNEIPNNLKCIICNKILINAYQAQCGCRYCHKCAEMTLNSSKTCPGNSVDCLAENLSTIVIDYRVNKEIAKFIIKCPGEMCSFECELENMNEHLRLCSKKKLKCPFYNLGCDNDLLIKESINEHMDLENYNHNTLLVETIDNLKNEVSILQKKQEIILNENQILKEEAKENKDQIDFLNAHLITDKKEIEELDRRFNVLETEFIDQIFQSTTDWNQKINENIQKIIEEINERNDNSKLRMQSEIDHLKNQVKQSIGIYCWEIVNFESIRKKSNWIMSEYYSSQINRYRFQIALFPTGNYSNNIYVYLRIHPGENDSQIDWPFTSDVIMTIKNRTNPNISISHRKPCQIKKPIHNGFCASDVFDFDYNDLITAGVLNDDCFIVECFIGIK